MKQGQNDHSCGCPSGRLERRDTQGAEKGARVGLPQRGTGTGFVFRDSNGLLKHLLPSLLRLPPESIQGPLGILVTQVHPFIQPTLAGPYYVPDTWDTSLSKRDTNVHLWSIRLNGGGQANKQNKEMN